MCPFAVRVPHGLSLADFLGSMITHTIRFLRGGLRTLKFSSDGGFACHPQHLHSSTGTSVAPRWFHCSVSTSPHAARVSVCGTGAAWVKLSGFSREYDYPHYQIPPRRTPYSQVQLGWWICLPSSTPTLFNGDFRRPAVVSLLRLHIAPCGSDGILTVSAIAIAVRLRLRTRLTPG